MNTLFSETDYKHVPAEQKERLHTFRMTHPRKQIDLMGTVTYTATIIIALAAQQAGRPDLIRSSKRVLAHVWEVF